MSSAFRITQATLANRVMGGLQGNLNRMQRLQEKLSSGREVARPSDSPSATASAMSLRSEMRRATQFARNAEDGIAWLGAADRTLTSTLDLTRRVRDLVLSAGNATLGRTERSFLATEIDTLRESMLGLANTTYLERPIFAGTAGGSSAYDASGNYLGDTGRVTRSIGAGTAVDVSLTGPEVFGAGPGGLFQVLSDLSAHLRSSDPAEVDALTTVDLERLDAARQNIQNRLSEVGARYHRVEMMQNRAQEDHVTLRSNLSSVEDIDLAATIMDLQLQEMAYQAALSASARVIQPALSDFLR